MHHHPTAKLTSLLDHGDDPLDEQFRTTPRAALSSPRFESLLRLAGQRGDQFEVLVEMQHGEFGELRRGRDQQIWNRRCSVLPALSECRLDCNGPILDEGREVLDRHRSDRRLGEQSLVIAAGSGGEADLETRHGADANESPLDPLRPRRSVRCEMQPAYRRLVDQPDRRHDQASDMTPGSSRSAVSDANRASASSVTGPEDSNRSRSSARAEIHGSRQSEPLGLGVDRDQDLVGYVSNQDVSHVALLVDITRYHPRPRSPGPFVVGQHTRRPRCRPSGPDRDRWPDRIARSGDPAERARFYDAVGVSGTYEPQVNRLILSTHPVGHVVRVGGPARRNTYRSLATPSKPVN